MKEANLKMEKGARPNKIVMGNWKMNGSRQSVLSLSTDLRAKLSTMMGVQCVVLPPTIYLSMVGEILSGSKTALGGQNIYPKDRGAFTGEVSVPMMKEAGCRYILVGHSERRNIFKESEKFIAEKFHHVKEHDIIPVLCVGERAEERANGQTKDILKRQIQSIVSNTSAPGVFSNCVIAYEPVWAIGTGKTATPEQAQEVHAYIRSLVRAYGNEEAETLPILYGGSVDPKNAAALFAMPEINGGLVGGASLDAQSFLEIVECIN